MKTNQYAVWLAVPALFLILGAAGPAQAKETNRMVRFLCDYGKNLYQRGDYENAVHEFSKALLINPRSEEARVYLEKMGLEEGIYGEGRTAVSEIGALAHDYDVQRGKMSILQVKNNRADRVQRHLQRQKDSLKSSITRKNESIRRLHQQKDALRTEADVQTSKFEQNIKNKNEEINDQNEALEESRQRYHEHLKQMSLQQLALSRKEGEIQEVKSEMSLTRDAMLRQDVSHRNTLGRLENELTDKSAKMKVLSQRYAAQQGQLQFKEAELIDTADRLSSYISRYNQSEAELCRQGTWCASNIYQLEEKVGELTEHSQDAEDESRRKVDSLEETLSDTSDQVNDLKNQGLIKDLETLGDREMVLAKESKIRQLSDRLNLQQGTLLESISKVSQLEQSMGQLKYELSQARKDLASFEQLAKEQDQFEAKEWQFKQEMQRSQQQLLEQDVILSEKKKRIEDLENRIAEMQERLDLAQRIVREKEDQIRSLTEELERNPQEK